MAALLGAWAGIQAIRRGDQAGRQAAAYLDALIRLGKLPAGAQVEEWLMQAQAATAAEGAKPEGQGQAKAK